MNGNSDLRVRLNDRQTASPDVTVLTRLEEACFPGEVWPQDTWQGLFAHRQLRLRLATVRSEPVGYAAFVVLGDEAELIRIGVHPAFRRQAVAMRLLSSVLDEMTSDGVREVWLEVRSGHAPAVALYRSLGFIPVGERSGYYRHPVGDALVFFRRLSGPT